jgi:hypothetical protein
MNFNIFTRILRVFFSNAILMFLNIVSFDIYFVTLTLRKWNVICQKWNESWLHFIWTTRVEMKWNEMKRREKIVQCNINLRTISRSNNFCSIFTFNEKAYKIFELIQIFTSGCEKSSKKYRYKMNIFHTHVMFCFHSKMRRDF